MNLDILVVAYRAKRALAQAVGSITYFSAPGYRLTIYENAGKNYPLTWLWNRFVEESRRPYIAVCNPDILVGPGWDTEAINCLESHPIVGAVNPLSNYSTHYDALQATQNPFECVMEVGAAEEKTAYLKKTFAEKRFIFGVDRKFLWGHCYIFRKSSWLALGGFDEKYQFGGNEYDFSERLVKRGERLGLCSHAFAYHLGNESTHDAKSAGVWDGARNQPNFADPPIGAQFGDV